VGELPVKQNPASRQSFAQQNNKKYNHELNDIAVK
jgi:hypothetical protein